MEPNHTFNVNKEQQELHAYIEEMERTLAHLKDTNAAMHKTLEELRYLANTDKLTDAWNRRHFEETIVGELDRFNRYHQPLSIILIDVDHFKDINDTHGHITGDAILLEIAEIIRTTYRSTDSLTRWGGDEYMVLCPGTPLHTTVILAERIRKRIDTATFTNDIKVTISVGVSSCIHDETWEQWFKRTDDVMYYAKACGRNQIHIAHDPKESKISKQNITTHFTQLRWHNSYYCHNAVIDSQHETLFNKVNQLFTKITSGDDIDQLKEDVLQTIVEIQTHFTDEQRILKEAGFPGLDAHTAIHTTLLTKAEDLIIELNNNVATISDVLQFVAYDVVVKHVLGTDSEFYSYLS